MGMNIQLYVSKKNFDVQKAERYFKERRITVQVMDLKKHRLGEREVQAMARALGGMQNLIDREDKKVKEHPACYYNQQVHRGLCAGNVGRMGKSLKQRTLKRHGRGAFCHGAFA